MTADILPFPGQMPYIADGIRVETLPVGVFKAKVSEDMEVSDLTFHMTLPKIPLGLLETVLNDFRRDLSHEAMVNIFYSRKERYYYLARPTYTADKVSVHYAFGHTKDILVMQLHSHNTMPAVFSSVDNEDEAATGLYAVLGELDTKHPKICIRAGMEGAFKYLKVEDVFQVPFDGAAA